MKNILQIRIIEVSFYLLFFLVPLILTPYNFELFEFNKMLSTYILTVIIVTSWALIAVSQKKLNFQKTILDIPLFLFLLSQIVSTVFSIDRHVSIFGYYSRFNGGLLSTVSYILLYFAFINNFPREKISTLLKYILSSAFIVSVYGILEHFGIDKNIWVQDVQNRVFSTLGQPNWLAAYLAVLTPLALGLYLSGIKYSAHLLSLSLIFFVTLLFTKSRSGFLGLGSAILIFYLLNYYYFKTKIIKKFIISLSVFLIASFLFGIPFTVLNSFSLPEIFKKQSVNPSAAKPLGGSIIDIGITESGVIRNIVWKGALNIFQKNPSIGTGVETFAYSYFRNRPVEHNMTSEWDYLYNKAHNEFLNYAATTGIFGLGSYLLITGIFIFWFLRTLKSILPENKNISIGLFSGWASIQVTNFFGFSVVIIQLLFFLIPGILIKLNLSNSAKSAKELTKLSFTLSQKVLTAVIFLLSFILLIKIASLWAADYYFAKGSQASRSQEYLKSYENLRKAIILNNNEPLYYDELAVPSSQIGLYFAQESDSTKSAMYINEALLASETALQISPQNVNFWKTKTKILYALSQIDETYLSKAIEALVIAKILSPTDPKLRYNLALMYDAAGRSKEAYNELEEATRLKLNYRDAYLAQAVFYARDQHIDKAEKALNFILERINPQDSDAKKQLETLK